jgi:hypothetical protein
MPLLVKNTTQGPLVFSVPQENIALEWQAAGDPSGEDFQQVPDALVENVAFLKNIQRGVLEVVEAPEALKEAIEKQTSAFQRRTQVAEDAARDAIDQQADNDLVTLPCVGPSGRGGGECGEAVPVRERTKWEKPALCSKHASMANQYVMTETDKLVDGKAEKRWHRAGVSPHEHQMV